MNPDSPQPSTHSGNNQGAPDRGTRKYPVAKDFDARAGTLPSNARGDDGNTRIVPSGRISIAATSLLALTAALSLLWSHYKLLDQDEIFVLQTDSVRTLRELVHIQLHYPISLDPMVYHALAHWSTCLFGANAFALRLPSLLGFLLMQVCLYVFTRRCFAGHLAIQGEAETAALIALAFPAITATLFYSAEARPYGLLLGFTALTLAAWQSATIPGAPSSTTAPSSFRVGIGEADASTVSDALHRPGTRTAALITLTAAIALALNTHYFAILLLIPLCLAELVRTITYRKLDLPVIAAIVAGIAAEAFTLPFQHAAAAFRLHYYNVDTLGPRAITQSYRALFADYTHAAMTTQHITAAAFVLLAFALVVAVAYRRTTRTLAVKTPEFTFVATLAALPFFGFLLGYFVTHTLEVRYVLGAIVGISILVALVLAPSLRNGATQRVVVAITLVAVLLTGVERVVQEKRNASAELAAMRPPPALQLASFGGFTPPVYIQEMGHFEVLSYYCPDVALRHSLTLVYSADNEIRYRHHDTEALTAEHMQHFTALPIVRYEDLRQESGQKFFLLYQGGWNWTGPAFAADHVVVIPQGPAMEGEAVLARFR